VSSTTAAKTPLAASAYIYIYTYFYVYIMHDATQLVNTGHTGLLILDYYTTTYEEEK